jgi:hypothetical protein
MIFNCGPTWAERAIARRTELSQWHPFFVLWPRRIGNRCVWLHVVRRKIRFQEDDYSGSWYKYPEYRFSLKDELRIPPP